MQSNIKMFDREEDSNADIKGRSLKQTSCQQTTQEFSPRQARLAQGYHSKTAENSTQKPPTKSYSTKVYVWGSLINETLSSQQESCLAQSNPQVFLRESFNPQIIAQMNGKSHESLMGASDSIAPGSLAKKFFKLKNTALVNVQCGRNHAACISKKGEVYMVGANDLGQLGQGDQSGKNTESRSKVTLQNHDGQAAEYFEKPVLLTSLLQKGHHVENIACGFAHNIAVTRGGRVFSWGYGKFGALGLGHYENRMQPTEVVFFNQYYQSDKEILMIQCGAHHTALLDKKGSLYLWGAGEVGQLGTGNRINESLPQLIQGCLNDGEGVESVALGYFHSLMLTSMGRVLQTGIPSKNLRAELPSSVAFCSSFKEVNFQGCAKSTPQILSVKAKEVSVAQTKAGSLILWSSLSSLQAKEEKSFQPATFFEVIQNDQVSVDDFELCKDYILVRSKDKFYRYSLDKKTFEPFTDQRGIKISELSILSCGHSYILGVRIKHRDSKRQRSETRNNKRMRQGLVGGTQNKVSNSICSSSSGSLGQQQSLMRALEKASAASLREGNDDEIQHVIIDKSSVHDGTSTQVRRISSGSMSRAESRCFDLQSTSYHNYDLQSQSFNVNLLSQQKSQSRLRRLEDQEDKEMASKSNLATMALTPIESTYHQLRSKTNKDAAQDNPVSSILSTSTVIKEKQAQLLEREDESKQGSMYEEFKASGALNSFRSNSFGAQRYGQYSRLQADQKSIHENPVQEITYSHIDQKSRGGMSFHDTSSQKMPRVQICESPIRQNDDSKSLIISRNMIDDQAFVNDMTSNFNNMKSLRISYEDYQLKCAEGAPHCELYEKSQLLESISGSGDAGLEDEKSSVGKHRQKYSQKSVDYDPLREKHFPMSDTQTVSQQQHHRIQGCQNEDKLTLSERKTSGGKERLKDALKKEIRQRLLLEQQLLALQQEFDTFKQEIGVDQMKIVLAESQEEYQKLYDVCVKECEKSSKLNDLFKREKKLREEREIQLLEIGEEAEMLKNQIRHLEEQLSILRDEKVKDSEFLKVQVLEQQAIIEDLRDKMHNEKEAFKEKIFDLEEQILHMNEQWRQTEDSYKSKLMLEQQSAQMLSNQNAEMKQLIHTHKQQLEGLVKQAQSIDDVSQENVQLKQQVLSMQTTLAMKNQNLKDCDQIIAQCQEKEKDYQSIIEGLRKQLAQAQSQPQVQPVVQTPQVVSPVAQSSSVNAATSRSQSSNRKGSTVSNPAGGLSQSRKQTGTSNRNDTLSNPKIISQTTIKAPATSTTHHQAYGSRKLSTASGANTTINTTANPVGRQQSIVSTPNSRSTARSHKQQTLTPNEQPLQEQRSKENSPQKLQQMIEQQDSNTKQFLTDISKIVGFKQSTVSALQESSNTHSTAPQQVANANKNRSNSPIDYLGLKPKSANTYAPRLGNSATASANSNKGASTVQQQQQQMNSSQSSATITMKSRNSESMAGGHQLNKDLHLKTYDETQSTAPSQYSFNVTPVPMTVTSSSKQLKLPQKTSSSNPATVMGCQAKEVKQQQQVQEFVSVTDKSIFDQESSSNHSKEKSGGSSIGNESSFVIEKSSTAATLDPKKKSVKFHIDSKQQQHCLDQSKDGEKDLAKSQSQNVISAAQSLKPSCQGEKALSNASSAPGKDEDEIDKLYESLANEMKGLKGGNVDNLKDKLDTIRKNKALLEQRIKEYEKKLGK